MPSSSSLNGWCQVSWRTHSPQHRDQLLLLGSSEPPFFACPFLLRRPAGPRAFRYRSLSMPEVLWIQAGRSKAPSLGFHNRKATIPCLSYRRSTATMYVVRGVIAWNPGGHTVPGPHTRRLANGLSSYGRPRSTRRHIFPVSETVVSR